MNTFNRREFLRKSTVGSASVIAGLSATGLFPRRFFAEEAPGFHRVVYRELGSTGHKVAELGFGAMNTRDAELIHAAIDQGINYIDTSHGYMRGVNEEIIGTVMKTKRDKVFLSTKVSGGNRTLEEMRERMELSLKRLQTDHVDNMFFKSPTAEEVLNEDYIRFFEKAKKDGLCRFVGVATHNDQENVLDAMIKSKFWEIVTVSYNYLSPESLTEAIKRARTAGIAIVTMKTQLKGKGYPDHDKGDITLNQAALKWVLQNPYVDTTIPGMTSFEQLQENLVVMGMRLSFNEDHQLQRYGKRIQGKYCHGVAGCTGCKDQCPKGVELCELNRCLGYAYGYQNLELARENYAELPLTSHVDICGDCEECQVQCVNGLDLTRTIHKTRELFA